ncbi:MAG: hypothetical protein KW793_04220 [Candidatus Doudnabacteria bacterium]|nr:hypothetical protein [Candidatus Doudnabacteria bacterium]
MAMILNRRRAYISVLAILLTFGAISYYANEQAKKLHNNNLPQSWTTDKQTPSTENDEEPIQSGSQIPAPAPTVIPPPPAIQKPQEKIYSYILTASEFQVDPKQLTVPSDKKVSLVIKTDSRYSGPNGLEFSSPVFASTVIKPGTTSTISFTATENFVIDVKKFGETAKLYSIIVLVK